MVKRICVLLLLCLALTACGKEPEAETTAETTLPPETTAETTTAPTETNPLTQAAWVRGEELDVVGGFLEKDTQVEITGYTDRGLAQVTTPMGSGTVDPQFLRTSGSFTPWQGYARWNAAFFENWDLLGSPVELLAVDTRVQVLEELDKCYCVSYNGVTGYIAKEQLSKYVYTAPSQESSSGSSSGSSGSSSRDGEDIQMFVPKLELLAQETGTAIVKVDRVPLTVGTAKLGQQVEALEEEAPKGWTAILDGGETRYLPTAWLLFDGQPEQEAWDGYAGYSCRLFDNPNLSGQPVKTVYLNAQVTVLWDTGFVSLIQFGQEVGYVSSVTLRQTPQATQPAEDSSGSSHSGSSSGSSGGTTGGRPSEDGWTPTIK